MRKENKNSKAFEILKDSATQVIENYTDEKGFAFNSRRRKICKSFTLGSDFMKELELIESSRLGIEDEEIFINKKQNDHLKMSQTIKKYPIKSLIFSNKDVCDKNKFNKVDLIYDIIKKPKNQKKILVQYIHDDTTNVSEIKNTDISVISRIDINPNFSSNIFLFIINI